MNIRKFFIIPILALTALVVTGCATSNNEISKETHSSNSTDMSQSQETNLDLNPVKSISHAHGLAVDAADSSKVYIATHNGLLVLKDEKNLYRIGNVQDDFMGFSAHPKRAETFFTSGHPQRGGNLGIQRSDDGGMSWTKLSNGVSGPVDFHSMTLSPANPNLLYGWYGALQRSADGGKNWELVPASIQNVISLTADPHNENVVYASTAKGLYKSTDQGKTWSVFANDLSSGAVTTLAVDPSNGLNMLSFSEAFGLAKSSDGGASWNSIAADLGIVLYFAFDTNNPSTVYALNRENSLYKSINGGDTWNKVK